MIDKDKTTAPAEESSKKDDHSKKSKETIEETWASDSQDELEDWIEEQGIQLRY